MTTRGLVLGKFMPPHAGHMVLCETARALVDELTILVCWLPDDPIAGKRRLAWMRECFPDCRVIGHGAVVPQYPEDDPDFWQIWRAIVREACPDGPDMVFAGEDYGLTLAEQVGAKFVPVLRGEWLAPMLANGLSASAVRADPLGLWGALPAPVRRDMALRVCLHGAESTGKSTLATRLARHYGTVFVPEYGRDYCEIHGTHLTSGDLLHIGQVQHAMINAAASQAHGVLFTDTDALMTAAWHEMLFDSVPSPLLGHPRADLYLLLEADVAWIDDGTRFFGEDDQRSRFAAISRDMLQRAGCSWISISGSWAEREAAAIAAIDALLAKMPERFGGSG